MMGGFFLAIIKNNLVKTLCYILDKCLYGNENDFKSLNSILIASCFVFCSVNRLSVRTDEKPSTNEYSR